MPRYEFKNKETGEIHDEIMSYEDKLLYLKNNPHMQTTFTGMNLSLIHI